jgi:predicted house-cleaning noncanonical NTP pyrophosphatase (MazG superfamily)
VKYNKLVRDNIPAILDSKGLGYKIRKASPEELRTYLASKLHEEVNEFIENPCIEELADIQEVLYGILYAYNWEKSSLKACAHEKRATRGGFISGVILDEVVD